jgi:hypothetical protein
LNTWVINRYIEAVSCDIHSDASGTYAEVEVAKYNKYLPK